jgi:hypothetical protein
VDITDKAREHAAEMLQPAAKTKAPKKKAR